METRANLTIVGIFVLAVIVAGFGAVSWLLGGTRGTNREAVTVSFPGSISGLAPGAAVNFNGIRVGEVISLGYAEDDPTQVLVHISVDRNVPIKVDSKVSLGYSGLTGLASVQITGGTLQAAKLFAVGTRRFMRSDAGSVQDVMEGARQVMGKADATLTEINNILRENGPGISRTVKNAETFSEAIAKNSGNIERFMADIGRSADVLARVADHAQGLIDDVNAVVKAVEPAKVRSSVDNIAKISADVAKASGEIEGIVARVKSAADEVAKLSVAAGQTVGDARKIIAAVDPDKIKATVDSVADFSKSLTGRGKDIDDIMAKSKSAAANIDSFTGNLAARNGDVAAIVEDARKISQRLEVASQRVDGILAKVDGVVGSGEAQGLFAEGRTFLAAATETAKSLRAMADTINGRADDVANGITRLTAATTRDLKDFVSDSRRMMNSIDQAVGNFDRNPQRLIFGGSGGGKVPDYGPGRR